MFEMGKHLPAVAVLRDLGRDKLLVDSALWELDFLKLVKNYPSLYAGAILENAIRRYELFWLPLAASQPTETPMSLYSAPLDVAWVWQVHTLAPVAYQKDCEMLVGKIVNHSFCHGVRRESLVVGGRQLWAQMYPIAEAFDVDFRNLDPVFSPYQSRLQYDIRSASARQSKFYYNVSLTHYRDPKFLADAFERYAHHLDIKRHNPQLFLVPCYDFDLIWHAHQMNPLYYRNDMVAILGSLLNHDDTETCRVPGSMLYDSEMQTRKAWACSGFLFAKRGAMHRGEPISPLPPPQEGVFNPLATLTYELELVQLSTNLKKKYEVSVQGKKGVYSQIVKGGTHMFGNSESSVALQTYSINTGENHKIRVVLTRCGFFSGLFGKKKDEGGTIDPKPYIEKWNAMPPGQAPPETFEVCCKDGKIEAMFRYTKAPTLGNFKLTVAAQPNFTKIVHVANILFQPKLMISQKDISKTELPGEITTNGISDHRGVMVFNAKVIHSAECVLSAVEIADVYGNVVASAHSLEPSALPDASELSPEDGKNHASLSVKEGARALLIRGRDHDFGICIGKWVKRQITTRVGQKIDRSFMGLKFFSLKEDYTGWCHVKKYKNGIFTISLLPSAISTRLLLYINLLTGEVRVPPGAADVLPQCLALSFAVAMLHLICRPYVPNEGQFAAPMSRKDPKRTVPHERGLKNEKSITKIRRRSLQSQSSIELCNIPAFVLAAGFCCMAVPSTTYLSWASRHIQHTHPEWAYFLEMEEYDSDYLNALGNGWGEDLGFEWEESVCPSDDWEDSTSEASGEGWEAGSDDWGDGGGGSDTEFGFGGSCSGGAADCKTDDGGAGASCGADGSGCGSSCGGGSGCGSSCGGGGVGCGGD